jgi:hypothetical protein
MRKRGLFVAREVELRARFACALQSAGYAVELACEEQRALRFRNFHVAIVASGPSSASLAMMQQLCDRVPGMIVLAAGPDEITRLRRSLAGLDAFFLKTADQAAVVTRVGEMTAPPIASRRLFRPSLHRGLPARLCVGSVEANVLLWKCCNGARRRYSPVPDRNNI